MPALDLLDDPVKIEHLEGYLYGMQEIENHISINQATTLEYSIQLLNNPTKQPDLLFIAKMLLERIQYNATITPALQAHFQTNIKEIILEDGQLALQESLKKWFIGKHLSEKHIHAEIIAHEKRHQQDWTAEQTASYHTRSKETEQRIKERLENTPVAATVFLDMIAVFMGTSFVVTKVDMTALQQEQALYPHAMYLYWGLEFDLFQLKNEQRNVLLHFGKLLG